MRIPRVACINDLSGFGRCSLTTAISIMSAAGVQVCPVPTAVLSKHTGFDSFYFSDLTESMVPYMDNWDDIDFDGIYSGFLGSEKQIKIVEDFILKNQSREHPVCIIVDPVMGDAGKLYPTYTPEMRDRMKALISHADLITPNITEACFLTGTEYKGEDISIDEAKELAVKLSDSGCKRVALTGIVSKNSMINLTYSDGEFDIDELHRETRIFSGTGDIFASVVAAFIMKGTTVFEAVSFAGKFISMAIEKTVELNTPLSEGVVFEPLLYVLGNE
jgi:pyridoxine kinase